jgi:hypothetical protein
MRGGRRPERKSMDFKGRGERRCEVRTVTTQE